MTQTERDHIVEFLLKEADKMSTNTAYIIMKLAQKIKEGKHVVE